MLRKSRTSHRRSDDSLELQPLHTPSKGVLRRMPRVRSDEFQDESHSDPPVKEEVVKETVTSPLGAGLPLLSRLRLLKEKQVRTSELKLGRIPKLARKFEHSLRLFKNLS